MRRHETHIGALLLTTGARLQPLLSLGLEFRTGSTHAAMTAPKIEGVHELIHAPDNVAHG